MPAHTSRLRAHNTTQLFPCLPFMHVSAHHTGVMTAPLTQPHRATAALCSCSGASCNLKASPHRPSALVQPQDAPSSMHPTCDNTELCHPPPRLQVCCSPQGDQQWPQKCLHGFHMNVEQLCRQTNLQAGEWNWQYCSARGVSDSPRRRCDSVRACHMTVTQLSHDCHMPPTKGGLDAQLPDPAALHVGQAHC